MFHHDVSYFIAIERVGARNSFIELRFFIHDILFSINWKNTSPVMERNLRE